MIVIMQEETSLLTSPSAGPEYIPVSTYPNLDDDDKNHPEGKVILSPSMMFKKI